MPDPPKFILAKFRIKPEVVGVYDRLEDAEIIRSRCLYLEENGVKYTVYSVVNEK